MGISLTITMISAGTIMRALRHRHLVTVLHPVPKLLVARVMVAASESQSRSRNVDSASHALGGVPSRAQNIQRKPRRTEGDILVLALIAKLQFPFVLSARRFFAA
jgi:hypothetical protein